MDIAANQSPGDRLTAQFTELGVALIEQALTPADLTDIAAAFPVLPPRTAGARAADFTPEARAWLAGHEGLLDFAGRLSQTPVRLSRLQAFDKRPGTNWFVPWHQDRAEDGQDRPVTVLERTLALRIHLDDCSEDSGPLEVIPRSHTQGRLEADAIARAVAETPPLLYLAARGDILALRPLLLHRSQRANRPTARRVIHIEYAAVAALNA